MTISNAMLKPYLSQLQSDLELLFQKIGFEADAELAEIKATIQKYLHTIACLKASVTALENHQTPLAPFELYAGYKDIKRGHHTIKRTLERFSSNQERIRKMQERRSHVAIFAA